MWDIAVVDRLGWSIATGSCSKPLITGFDFDGGATHVAATGVQCVHIRWCKCWFFLTLFPSTYVRIVPEQSRIFLSKIGSQHPPVSEQLRMPMSSMHASACGTEPLWTDLVANRDRKLFEAFDHRVWLRWWCYTCRCNRRPMRAYSLMQVLIFFNLVSKHLRAHSTRAKSHFFIQNWFPASTSLRATSYANVVHACKCVWNRTVVDRLGSQSRPEVVRSLWSPSLTATLSLHMSLQ